MKVRTSFITNSSSSSFVIAIHNDATKDDIRNILSESVKEHMKELWYNEVVYEELLEEVTDEIYGHKRYGMTLGEWKVNAETYYSDNDDKDFIIYCMGEIYTDKLKMKGGD